MFFDWPLLGSAAQAAGWGLIAVPTAWVARKAPRRALIAGGLSAGGAGLAMWLGHAIPELAIGSVAVVTFAASVKRWRHVVLVPALVAGALIIANTQLRLYPTIRAAVTTPTYVSYADLSAAGGAADKTADSSVLTQVQLGPGRPADVYLPANYLNGDTPPVVILMHGIPGYPQQWMDMGAVPSTFDLFAAEHGGRAPVIVSVDVTGSDTANPGCMGWVDTMLREDLPGEILGKFHVDPNTSTWVLGGLSYGGTCALHVATVAPDTYGGYIDMSGEENLNVGSEQETVDKLFDGDENAYRANNPADLMKARTYPGLNVQFYVGKNDATYKPGLQRLFALAQQAGMNTTWEEIPGGHDWGVWRQALIEATPFIEKIGGFTR